MKLSELFDRFELCPIVAAVRDDAFGDALDSPVQAVILLDASVMTVGDRIASAHGRGKAIFIHIDLAAGVGKDPSGVRYLADLGADGVISTRADLVKSAKEAGVIAIQRYFALDSHGIASIDKMIAGAKPDCIELMPGVIGKIVKRFSDRGLPVIASGLVETKAEATAALGSGAVAVTTSKKELWRM